VGLSRRYRDDDDDRAIPARATRRQFTSSPRVTRMTTTTTGATAAGNGGCTGDAEGHSKPPVAAGKSVAALGAPIANDDDRRYSRSRDEEGRFTSSRSRYIAMTTRQTRQPRARRLVRDPGATRSIRRGWEERVARAPVLEADETMTAVIALALSR